jgi:squalene-hopene/tetraprenyl-beta-curcumene cyclase
MRTWTTRILIGGLLLAAVPATPTPAQTPTAAAWEKSVDRAVAYLRKTQAEDGSWGAAQSPGITGIVVTGLLKTGRVPKNDPMIEKALGYIESLINRKEGHIAGKDPKKGLQNYVTCVNVLALTAADRPAYKAVIADAAKFLKKLQWDEEEGKKRDDAFFGGAGYDSKSRPDLSNTQLFLDALKAAGIPKDDPAYKNAIIFVSRCQNLKGEHNDQSWADKINDGSFIYTPALGGDTKVQDKPNADGGLPGYGSMTYAGVKSLIYCGVGKDDERIQKAVAWLRKNYNVEANPGMPGVRSEWGLYYYYHTMAKSLNALGEDPFVDDKGVKHNWRADIIAALVKRQKEDGSWSNAADRWMEANPALVTGYALMTLAQCKK